MNNTEKNQENSNILIITVGTSIEPLIKTIDYHRPTYVLYVVSDDTRESIRKINDSLSWKIKDFDIINISDPENIASTMKEIREGIQKFLILKKLSSDVCLDADITGGTKPMSAALSQVVTELAKCRILYVGGTQRNPDERMIVVNGKEKFIHVGNPWDELGYYPSRRLAFAFNSSQFQVAEEEAKFLREKRISYELFYENLATVIKAFSLWERFNYREAQRLMGNAVSKLKFFNNNSFPAFIPLYEKLNKASEILAKVEDDARFMNDSKIKLPLPEDKGRKYLLDLLSNARRCASNGRYDDAVARLYSVIEKSAKIALAQLGKDNSKLLLEDLREAKGDFEEKYAKEIIENKDPKKSQGAKLGLTESFRYLKAIAPQHPLVKAYYDNEEDINNAIMARNLSLLAHGFLPIKEENYQTLFQAAMKLLEVEKDELWDFPQMRHEEILI